jgi:hypothetical protein
VSQFLFFLFLLQMTLHVLSRVKKAGRQNHALTQWKMFQCKTVVNIISTYLHVV